MEKANTPDLHEAPTTLEEEAAIEIGDTVRLKGLSSKDSPRMVVVDRDFMRSDRVFTCVWFSYDLIQRMEIFSDRVLRKVVFKKSKKRR